MNGDFNKSAPEYSLKRVFVMRYMPKIRSLAVKSRSCSSLMLVIRGKYHYRWKHGDIFLNDNDIVYLPKYSEYEYTVISEHTECIQAEFDLMQNDGSEISYKTFGDHPIKTDGGGENAALFYDLLNSYYNNEFLSLSLIYKLLAPLVSQGRRIMPQMHKIAPALELIERDYCQKIYSAELAGACGLSQAHLRRLFRECIGMSPVQYKNMLLINAARHRLCSEHMRVSEVADELGFQDIYSFSQLFKKHTGLSPKKYSDIYSPGGGTAAR